MYSSLYEIPTELYGMMTGQEIFPGSPRFRTAHYLCNINYEFAMTTRQFEERVGWKQCGYGTYDVTISYRGKQYHCKSHNTLASDDYQSDSRSYYKTDKQCLMAFYDECKRVNHLGEYGY